MTPTDLTVELTAVILAVTDEVPRIVTVPASAIAGQQAVAVQEALPTGRLDPAGHATLEKALRGWVGSGTGLELGYVEQLYTFGDRHRHPDERSGGPRVVSVAYLTLVDERPIARRLGAQWRDAYRFLPWEDWRGGRPDALDDHLLPALGAWVESGSAPHARDQRRERVAITFGLGGAPWNEERVLERYELLYEAELVPEVLLDRGAVAPTSLSGEAKRRGRLTGRPLIFDHRRMLATALGRLRGKLSYRPVVFELLPETFTLLQLQRVVEALAGVRLHKQNFRRLVDRGGLVEGTGQLGSRRRGRPAELFRFRREVLRERPAPGVGLPRRARRGE